MTLLSAFQLESPYVTPSVAVRLQEEVEEATLSYRFKFSEGYDWTMGGKLPGLADEDMASGCRSEDVDGTGSFVSRTMWRIGGGYHFLVAMNCQSTMHGEL